MPAPETGERPRYWFPAKTYGWGWGWPSTWQGWLVLAGYCVVLLVVAWLCPPDRSPASFLASVIGLSTALVTICWLKGEPPTWRWGRKDQP